MHVLCKKDNIINVPFWNLFCVSFNFPVNLIISMCQLSLISYRDMLKCSQIFHFSIYYKLSSWQLLTDVQSLQLFQTLKWQMLEPSLELLLFLESYLRESAGLGRSDFFTQQGPRERDNQANSIVDDDISEFFSP